MVAFFLMTRESKPRKGSATAAPPARAGDWSHPQFNAPTAAPERLSVPPPPKR